MTGPSLAYLDPTAPSVTAAADSLVQQLFVLTKAVRSHFHRRLAEANASLPTWSILSALDGNEKLSQRQLGGLCSMEGPMLTRYLDRLTLQGFVLRERDKRDRRIVRVSFTDEGRAYYRSVKAVAADLEEAIEKLLSPEEQEHLVGLLSQITVSLASC